MSIHLYAGSFEGFEDFSNRAMQEEAIMELAPRINFLEISPLSVDGLINTMKDCGVVRLNDLIDREQVKSLLLYVNKQLADSIAEVAVDRYQTSNHFANSKAQTNRWDLKLAYNDVIDSTMKALLCRGSLLGDTLHGLVGDNASIVELAAFVTTKDASRQIIHSDTFWSETSNAFTCTVALQDIDQGMGPTVFIPRTHTKETYLERVAEYLEMEEGM